MNQWGRLMKHANKRERNNKTTKDNETERQREARLQLAALAGARTRVDESKVEHKLVRIWTKGTSLTRLRVFF